MPEQETFNVGDRVVIIDTFNSQWGDIADTELHKQGTVEAVTGTPSVIEVTTEFTGSGAPGDSWWLSPHNIKKLKPKTQHPKTESPKAPKPKKAKRDRAELIDEAITVVGMQTNDATVVMVFHDEIVGVGTAKRLTGDPFNAEYGQKLATARALEDLAQNMRTGLDAS